MMSNSAFTSSSDQPERLATILKGDFSAADSGKLNDQHCLELFQRALVQDSQRAKEEFQRQLSQIVLAWVRLHPRKEETCRYQKEERYAGQAFASFWAAMAQYKEREFSTLTAVLEYLKASVNAVMVEILREQSRSKDASTVEHRQPEKPVPAGHENSNELWKNIHSLCSDAREQRLAYLLFHCGLKPGEIVQFYPQEYSNVREIARLRNSIIVELMKEQALDVMGTKRKYP